MLEGAIQRIDKRSARYLAEILRRDLGKDECLRIVELEYAIHETIKDPLGPKAGPSRLVPLVAMARVSHANRLRNDNLRDVTFLYHSDECNDKELHQDMKAIKRAGGECYEWKAWKDIGRFGTSYDQIFQVVHAVLTSDSLSRTFCALIAAEELKRMYKTLSYNIIVCDNTEPAACVQIPLPEIQVDHKDVDPAFSATLSPELSIGATSTHPELDVSALPEVGAIDLNANPGLDSAISLDDANTDDATQWLRAYHNKPEEKPEVQSGQWLHHNYGTGVEDLPNPGGAPRKKTYQPGDSRHWWIFPSSRGQPSWGPGECLSADPPEDDDQWWTVTQEEKRASLSDWWKDHDTKGDALAVDHPPHISRSRTNSLSREVALSAYFMSKDARDRQCARINPHYKTQAQMQDERFTQAKAEAVRVARRRAEALQFDRYAEEQRVAAQAEVRDRFKAQVYPPPRVPYTPGASPTGSSITEEEEQKEDKETKGDKENDLWEDFLESE
ncbi:hypothetical protein LTR04_001814 [Oleoguttula sp. CCFEE 6159]|nr:hypothetical protein LTR04_001814 [Oleoguttula sp. CCFEE 6159]